MFIRTCCLWAKIKESTPPVSVPVITVSSLSPAPKLAYVTGPKPSRNIQSRPAEWNRLGLAVTESPREVQGSVSLTSEVRREDWYICFSKRTFKLSEVNLEKPFGLPCVCVVSVGLFSSMTDIRLRVRGCMGLRQCPLDAVTCDSVGVLRR